MNNKIKEWKGTIRFVIVWLIMMLLFYIILYVHVQENTEIERLSGTIVYEDNEVFFDISTYDQINVMHIPSRLAIEDKEDIEYARLHSGETIECDVKYIYVNGFISWDIAEVYY